MKFEPVKALSVTTSRWKTITLEPTVFLYFGAMFNSQLLETNLLLEKSLSRNGYDETEAEADVAGMDSWKMAGSTALGLIVTSYAALLSDRSGKYRLVFLYLPILGQILNDISNIIHVLNWNWPPFVAAITQAIIPGLSGSKACLTMTSVSYLSHLSEENLRTIKIGHYFIALSSGMALGVGVSGYAQHFLGFYGGFVLSAVLNVMAVFLAIIFVQPQWDINEVANEGKDGKSGKFPPFGDVLKCLYVLSVKRNGCKRLIVILTVIIYPLVIGGALGQLSVFYLYMRYKFNWTSVDYGLYSLVTSVINIIGTIFTVEVISHKLGVDDATIGVIGSSLWIVSSILYLVAHQTWQIYAISASNALIFAMFTVLVSIGTKCVENAEYGQLNAVYGLTQAISLLAYPLYNQVYRSTLNAMPTSFFFITIVLITPALIAFTIMKSLKNPIADEYEKI